MRPIYQKTAFSSQISIKWATSYNYTNNKYELVEKVPQEMVNQATHKSAVNLHFLTNV